VISEHKVSVIVDVLCLFIVSQGILARRARLPVYEEIDRHCAPTVDTSQTPCKRSKRLLDTICVSSAGEVVRVVRKPTVRVGGAGRFLELCRPFYGGIEALECQTSQLFAQHMPTQVC
jgi:hypothetical protein